MVTDDIQIQKYYSTTVGISHYNTLFKIKVESVTRRNLDDGTGLVEYFSTVVLLLYYCLLG